MAKQPLDRIFKMQLTTTAWRSAGVAFDDYAWREPILTHPINLHEIYSFRPSAAPKYD